MLPRDIAKTPVTLYNLLHILGSGGNDYPIYKRTVIPDCVWQQDSQATYRRTGTLNAEAITLLIPFDPEYFSVQNGEIFEGKGWTIQLGSESTGSYIVKGDCPFEFPPYGPISEEYEEDFLRRYVLPFEKHYKYKRPKEIIEHFVGSRSLWYIEVRG